LFLRSARNIKEKEQILVGSEIRIMCLSVVTCLSTDCCFSELALYRIKLSVLV
jgi:hypothetical protein